MAYLIRMLITPYFMAAVGLFSLNAMADDKAYFEAKKIQGGLHVLIGRDGFTGGNILVSSGDDGVFMVDASMPKYLDKLNQSLKKVGVANVDYLINTHVHNDHIGNNQALGQSGARIIAHQNVREYMLNNKEDAADTDRSAPIKSLPILSFKKEMGLYLNQHDVRLVHLPRAHTNGDTIIVFKQANVIHAGDILFNGKFPYIDLDRGGSVEGYIRAQSKIYHLANDKTVIVPGHGELATKKALGKQIEMLNDARDIVKKLIQQHKNLDQILALQPLAKYQAYSWSFINSEKMVTQLYNDLVSLEKHNGHNGGAHAQHDHSHHNH